MNKKNKLIDINLILDPRPLSKAEEEAISAFIQADKAKETQREKVKRKSKTALSKIRRKKIAQ
jgi:hypothetical protein